MTPAPDGTTIFVTGASQRYWRCLWQVLGNIEARGLYRRAHFVAFDLGLEATALTRLKERYPWCEFRRFAFENYPAHVAMAAGSYAFKPLIISRMMEETRGVVFWFDSATLFHTSDLSFLEAVIKRNGIYALRGQAPLGQRCDPEVLTSLQIPFFILRKPELVAGVLGFNSGEPNIRALVREWAGHALIKEHIAPRIPRRSFHMPEQALLTWLVYRGEDNGVLRLTGEEIDISSRAPVRWMSSRNFIPPGAPLWAGALFRLYYAAYKTVDQMLWRLRHLRGSRLNGLHRRIKEHFSVLMRDGAGKVWRLRPPSWCYFADPFLLSHEEKRAILVERFDYRSNMGDLCAIALGECLRAGPAVPILSGHGHASFPYVFRHDGQLYLVPETCQDRCVELHRCEEFPNSWRRVRTILDDIDAADSVIFPKGSHWWLITSVRQGAVPRHLEIYFTDDPLHGTWLPHPVNGERLYQGWAFSSGRNGGGILEYEGLLLRPAQSSRRFYGEGLQFMQIDALSPTEFRERPYEGPHPLRDLIVDFSPHHLSVDLELAAFDIRDRARGGEGLWARRLKARPHPAGDIPIPPLRAKVAQSEAGLG